MQKHIFATNKQQYVRAFKKEMYDGLLCSGQKKRKKVNAFLKVYSFLFRLSIIFY